MRLTRDRKKAAANLAKHGVDFLDAIEIFTGTTVEWIDERFQYAEERWLAIGVSKGTEICIAYAEEKEDLRRIISARKATRGERERYWREVSR
jgi:uncharacterized DUF497 family protein